MCLKEYVIDLCSAQQPTARQENPNAFNNVVNLSNRVVR
jgi:hypothetical protein